MDKNSVFTGLVIGALIPVVGYMVTEFIFLMLTKAGLMEYVTGGGLSRRMRTLCLIGICFNLIPFNICRKKRWDNTMRGIVFPTLIYVGAWIWVFGRALF